MFCPPAFFPPSFHFSKNAFFVIALRNSGADSLSLRIPYDHAWKPLRAKPKKWLRRIPFFVSFFLSERAAGEENFLPLEPEAECFAPPGVLPPPKNSGRVGGAKHPDATGCTLIENGGIVAGGIHT